MGEDDFKLSDINFGSVDGEKEAESDDFLQLFYTGNKSYEDIMNPQKFIISGRKGTGKTLLAKYVQKMNSSEECIVEYKKLNCIELHQYIDIDKADFNIDDRIMFQEYFIYKQFCQIIITNKRRMRSFICNNGLILGIVNYMKYRNKLKSLMDYYNNYYDNNVFKEKERRIIEKITSMSNGKVGVGEKAGISYNGGTTFEQTTEHIQVKKSFLDNYENLKNMVDDCLRYINVILIIDDLDEIRMDEPEHKINFLLNLVEKVEEVNTSMRTKGKKSKCILLIRSDIISSFSIRSGNIQKTLSTSLVDLQWFKDASGNELSNMIMNKIKNSSNKFSDLTLEEIRKKIFVSNGKKKNNEDSFDEIVSYGFGRPRDVITYLQCIIKMVGDNKKIFYQDISAARLPYSNKFYGEIKNELSFLWSPDKIKDVEKLLRDFSRNTFEYSELFEFYNENSDSYINIDEDIFEIMSTLYKVGCIANYRKPNKKSMIFMCSYRNGPEELSKTNRIIIHQGIRKALNL